jgi:uncharacterized protein
MKNHCKRRIFIFGLLLPLSFTGPAISQSTPAEQSVSYPRNQALYVTLHDGTKIAIDVWLPENLSPGAKIPTILRATPYNRAADVDKGVVEKFPPKVQLRPTGDNFLDQLDFQAQFQLKEPEVFNNHGYALVTVDFRGRGASFGTAPTLISPEDGKDLSEIVDWVVAQSWSNHKVGATGISLPGTAADLLALTNNPAVKAIVPRFIDFDLYAQQIFPGGLLNANQVKSLNEALQFLDTSPCSFGQRVIIQGKEICEKITKAGFRGVKPVDEDKDKRLLAEAVQQHVANTNLEQAFQPITYRDDTFGRFTPQDSSPFKFKSEIERSNVAIYSWAGWLDGGTASGTVSRFMTFRNPQKAVIGPWNHGAFLNANPFSPPGTPVKPSIEEQFQDITKFFDTYLKDNAGAPQAQRELKYYTMVEDQWKTTDVWPPKGIIPQRFFLAGNNSLTKETPKEPTGEDKYTVNFEATTGRRTRWEQANSELDYGNRAEEDKKLLIYNSKAVKDDVEITGTPIVNLLVNSTADDGAFIVYLEDVAPDGKVTYITEGQLRPLHRKVSQESPPYAIFGPHHSFKKQDGLPLKPGEITELSFELAPTSVVIQKGHQIRVAIAGQDKDTFARYPAEGTPIIGIQRNAVYASYIDIPMMNSKSK